MRRAPGASGRYRLQRPGVVGVDRDGNGAGTELRTFLIADIRGYTTYTREHGDEAAGALAARFAEIVREVAEANEGFLLELRGDEALVVFVSARNALRAAVAMQARLRESELPRGVGIGLDAGEAVAIEGGYRGGPSTSPRGSALERSPERCSPPRP